MIEEGKAKIKIDGVFYNPRMKFCRDLDMVVFSEFKSTEYLDALAASGIRGIRATIEASKHSIFNDKDLKAVRVIEENLKLNGITGKIYCKDVTLLLREEFFEHVDIDPFGSPSVFIDSACSSAKKYLSVTATDTAALCGSATGSGLKKYGAYAVKTDTYHETGLRMLAGFVIKEATKYEKVLTPLISWAREHYYRIHFSVRKSTSQSAKVYSKMGYINYCPRCLKKKVSTMGEGYDRCSCGGRFIHIGPLWLGELKHKDFIERIFKKAEGKLRSFVERLRGEVDVATAYNLQMIASRVKGRAPSTTKVIEKLVAMGYSASKTHYCGFCVKTNADIAELYGIIRQ